MIMTEKDERRLCTGVCMAVMAVALVAGGTVVIDRASVHSHEDILNEFSLVAQNWTDVNRAVLSRDEFSIQASIGDWTSPSTTLLPDNSQDAGMPSEVLDATAYSPLRFQAPPEGFSLSAIEASVDATLNLEVHVHNIHGRTTTVPLPPITLLKQVRLYVPKPGVMARNKCLYSMKGEYRETERACLYWKRVTSVCFQLVPTPAGDWTTEGTSGSGGCTYAQGEWDIAQYSRVGSAVNGTIPEAAIGVTLRSKWDPYLTLVDLTDGTMDTGQDASSLRIVGVLLIFMGCLAFISPIVVSVTLWRRCRRAKNPYDGDPMFTSLGMGTHKSSKPVPIGRRRRHRTTVTNESDSDDGGRGRMSDLAARHVATLQQLQALRRTRGIDYTAAPADDDDPLELAASSRRR